MRKKLSSLVGRYVRLKMPEFRKVAKQDSNSPGLENLFVVAAITHGVNKLICYGGGYRVAVAPCNVVMV